MNDIPRMTWASASSRLELPAAAAAAVAAELQQQLGIDPAGEGDKSSSGRPDLVLAFVSGPGRGRTAAAAEVLRRELPAATFAVTSARGVVTREHEVEHGVCLSAVAARLPGVDVKP